MSDPVLLYCIGATKAGTSWLYRALYDRPDCALSAVKETHYWDTAPLTARDQQIGAFTRQRVRFLDESRAAKAEDKGWKVRNMARRIEDMTRLIDMLARDRTDHSAYVAYLMGRADAETRLIADICPSYALLPAERLREMATLSDQTRFLYLVRDPLSRLWSAVRMQAERQKGPGEAVEEKANNILWRILNRAAEAHLTERGDYAATAERLMRAVDADKRAILYMENVVTQEGFEALLGFLGLDARQSLPERVHEGQAITMRPHLRDAALSYLEPHYAWAEATLGPLPKAWRESREGMGL